MTADMGNSQSPSSGDVSQRNPADSGGTSGKRMLLLLLCLRSMATTQLTPHWLLFLFGGQQAP